MICLNCGKHVDDDVRVCPFCGSEIEAADTMPLDTAEEDGPIPVTLSERRPAAEARSAQETSGAVRTDEPEKRRSGFFTPAFALSLLSFALSLVCLVMILSLRDGVAELNKSLTDNLGAPSARPTIILPSWTPPWPRSSPTPTSRLPASPYPSRKTSRRLPARWTRTGTTRCSSCGPRAI